MPHLLQTFGSSLRARPRPWLLLLAFVLLAVPVRALVAYDPMYPNLNMGSDSLSSGGPYELISRVNQPVAGQASGGAYVLTVGPVIPHEPPSPDVNGDGSVGISDLSFLVQWFGAAAGDADWDPYLDVVPDGRIDLMDLVWIAKQILQ